MKDKIDLTKFKKIYDWHLDDYTGYYTITLSDGKFTYKMHKDTVLDGCLRKGSYMSITNKKVDTIVSASVLTQAQFNKLQKERV